PTATLFRSKLLRRKLELRQRGGEAPGQGAEAATPPGGLLSREAGVPARLELVATGSELHQGGVFLGEGKKDLHCLPAAARIASGKVRRPRTPRIPAPSRRKMPSTRSPREA